MNDGDLHSSIAVWEGVWHEQELKKHKDWDKNKDRKSFLRIEIWIESSDPDVWNGTRLHPGLDFDNCEDLELIGDKNKVKYPIPSDWGIAGEVQFRKGFSWGKVVEDYKVW